MASVYISMVLIPSWLGWVLEPRRGPRQEDSMMVLIPSWLGWVLEHGFVEAPWT